MFGRKEVNLSSLVARVAALERRLAEQDQIIAQLGGDSSTPLSLQRPQSGLHPDVVALLQQGKKIAAIKRHRELTGAGLKEAKETVEASRFY
ncbi:50S ribosomal protein L7/L12 [Corynebacterium glutamicum]|uniref:ribosomal protein bL12 n=1 Tax=Corynebacterium glutamicum TaxID=1718 RepID=UPI0004F71CDB|nr:50S ribosomal protein L7/L12 [Corynebacterium glutamicum]AIK84159.1 50S ribosomal protein L7/L12 [Corynebacterium glutamicum]AIK86943.1 50S ribosomal protein L7/L12 [Corynebacterium glutamicum]